ncbi:MAG: dihydrodipicolinate synthase family protein [Bryobacteraceae bacterium]|nr:dihydrodipicolinate synthase family protein [Bryobacteraceae bacterium]
MEEVDGSNPSIMVVLRGVFPIVCTTFGDDGSLDLNSQVRLVRHLIDAGAHGLGLFGNASEGWRAQWNRRCGGD